MDISEFVRVHLIAFRLQRRLRVLRRLLARRLDCLLLQADLNKKPVIFVFQALLERCATAEAVDCQEFLLILLQRRVQPVKLRLCLALLSVRFGDPILVILDGRVQLFIYVIQKRCARDGCADSESGRIQEPGDDCRARFGRRENLQRRECRDDR